MAGAGSGDMRPGAGTAIEAVVRLPAGINWLLRACERLRRLFVPCYGQTTPQRASCRDTAVRTRACRALFLRCMGSNTCIHEIKVPT